ncbi:MAG: hypothetical protein ACRDRZ_08745 [Pseudonocardiaceae bacterium]
MVTGAGRTVVLLHVGTPKTGTTYLQDVLWRNRGALRRRGVLYPGDRPQSHFLAAMDLQGGTAEEVGDADLPGAWSRLVGRIRGWTGTAVVSHELLAPMDAARIGRAHAELGFAELHVVCTVRDLARQLPAVWQEDLKNRHSLTFAEFVEAVRAPEQGHWLGELFWRMQDIPEVLRRWAAMLPPERVHVVTVPARGESPEALWERFGSLLGVPLTGLDAGSTEPNSSLGPAEAHLLRRINSELDPALPWPVYERTVRRQLIDVLARRPGDSQRLGLPAAELGWVRERSERTIAALRAAGYRVVGDLDDLLPCDDTSAAHPDEVTDSDLLDAALDAIRELVARDVSAQPATIASRSAALGRRVVELSGHHAGLRRVRSLYRSVRRFQCGR